MMRNLTVLILTKLLLLINVSYAAEINNFPGIIPLESSRPPATDLLHNGKLLLPIDAKKLEKSGLDISKLNPGESDIWGNKTSFTQSNDKVLEDNSKAFEYLSPVASRSGNFRFTVHQETEFGKIGFTLMLSKKIHNVLLRKNILRKLGYKVPKIEHLKTVKLKFSSKFEFENFKNQLGSSTFGDPARWIKTVSEDEKEVELQDIIIMKSDVLIYNLALGFMPGSVIKGRRILNSLLIPYALTEVPESANLFPWNMGKLVSEHIRLTYDEAGEFSTTYNDAKWILDRLKKLTRKDFEDVVEGANYPEAVSKLVTEKLIARRNTVLRLFNIENTEIDFDSKIDWGDELLGGKLLQENWEGYGSRFSFGDPHSPLSSSEIFAFFKSKILSNVISNAVTKFNNKVIPHTDIQQKLVDRQIEKAKENFANFIQTGEVKKTSFGFYAIPKYDINLIASRDIVAGSYLGADNIVQLADTVGLNVSLGVFIGTDGVKAPWTIDGGAQGSITRRYTHLRPIQSMKKALKTPFKNILVQLTKKKLGHFFDEITLLTPEQLKETEWQEKVSQVMGEFRNHMEVGESLMITDSIGASINARVAYRFGDALSAQLAFMKSQKVISRLHIYRKDDSTIQIYKDLGNIKTMGLSFGINSYIPILNFSIEKKKGTAKTKFYQLNINDNVKENPGLIKSLRALKSLFLHNDLELAGVINKPYVVKHKFSEKVRRFSFFHKKWLWQKNKDFITIEHPLGGNKYFYRRLTGKRKGDNYQALATDVINGLINEFTESSTEISNAGNGNPGDTFAGKSVTRKVIFEGEVENYLDEKGLIEDPFVNIVYQWKGWSLKARKAKKIISKLNAKYQFNFFPENIFNTTKKVQLYSLNLNLYLYSKAIDSLANISKGKSKGLFASTPDLEVRTRSNESYESAYKRTLRSLIGTYQRLQRKYKEAVSMQDIADQSKYASKMANLVESTLPLDLFLEFVGGKENIYISSRLQGFRDGDENGDEAIVSHSIGQIGKKYFAGPLLDMRNRLGMTESEFLIYWILGRI
jgi:hypothetical protein